MGCTYCKRLECICLDLALQPKQEELYHLVTVTGPTVPTWLGYGGARGGGKSIGVDAIAIAVCIANPGVTVVIVRRVEGDIIKNHIDPMLSMWPKLRAWYTENRIDFSNGAMLLFEYAQTTREVERKFMGPSYALILVDQAEQFSEYELTIIKTACRWGGAVGGFAKVVLAFNPGGQGTAFLRRIFWLKEYRGEEQPHDFAFIHAFGWDNYEWFRNEVDISPGDFYNLSHAARFELFIHHTTEGRKMNALPPNLRAGHLLGSFTEFAGQYFAGVWDEGKCVISPSLVKQIAPNWSTRWTSTDWGFKHAACHIWWTIVKLSPEKLYQYLDIESDYEMDVILAEREQMDHQVGPRKLIESYVAATPVEQRIQREFVSPDTRQKRTDQNTIEEEMTDAWIAAGFVGPELADDDRVGGWRLLYSLFEQTCDCRGAKITADMATRGPLLLINHLCVEVRRAIPLAIFNNIDPKKSEDVLKTATDEDDVLDCLRYGVKSWLHAKTKAPRDVRAQETWDNAGESMTARAMAMRVFEANEKKTVLLSRGRRGR